MAPKPNPDRDERFRIPVDDPIEGLAALLKVDPDAEPVLTPEEVDKLARVAQDNGQTQ